MYDLDFIFNMMKLLETPILSFLLLVDHLTETHERNLEIPPWL